MDSKTKRLAGIIRRCLGSKYILRSRSKELFTAIEANHAELASFFSMAGLTLEVESRIGLAYLKSCPEIDDEIGYKFGRTTTLRPYETLALVLLRQKRLEFFSGSIESDAPTISKKELREFLDSFNKEKEDKKFERKFQETIDELAKHQIVLSTFDEGLLEISPVVDIILPADEISRLLAQATSYFTNSAPATDSQPEVTS